MPSVLSALYDGKRRGGRDYVLLLPLSAWGERAFGLAKPDDDYRLQPAAPAKGQQITLTVSDRTLFRLRAQRQRRLELGRQGRR